MSAFPLKIEKSVRRTVLEQAGLCDPPDRLAVARIGLRRRPGAAVRRSLRLLAVDLGWRGEVLPCEVNGGKLHRPRRHPLRERYARCALDPDRIPVQICCKFGEQGPIAIESLPPEAPSTRSFACRCAIGEGVPRFGQ